MGLISAAAGAIGSTLHDQWKEFFYCDALSSDTIAVKAQKKTKGFLNRNEDNIISDGSLIAVADGQCMIIVEQGQVVEICAEPGEYRYDNSIAQSLFAGDLSKSISNTLDEIGKRFTFGGKPAADQRIYFFNTKELTGNKFGTASPVPFRVIDQRAGIDIDISIRCFGEYSFRITNPIQFYTNNSGNFHDVYTTDMLASQMRSELLSALQPAFASISANGIRYSQLPAHTTELCEALKEQLSDKWTKERGIEIASIAIASVTADPEDEKMLKEMQRNAAYTNPNLAAATLVGAQADAMKAAASNTAGAMNGFMGMNFAQNAGGANIQNLYAAGQTQQAPPQNGWTCPKCGTSNTGKFCSNCGTEKPAGEWFCPQCGTKNTGNFCSNCGTKKPA